MEQEQILGRACCPELKELETDILVLGGGLPGVCAAIAAAQRGHRVVLVEHRLTLGGNCGPEIGVHPSDAHRFHPYMVSTGIVGSLIEDAAYYHAKIDSNDHHYNVSMRFDTVLMKALQRAGVQVLRGVYAHTPYVKEGSITAVDCEDTMTYQRIRIRVAHFVIDDTGDGNVSAAAGAAWRMGRESKQEFGERLAPELGDETTMGSSLVTLIRNTNDASPFYPDPDTPPFYPGYGGDGPFCPEDGASLYFWFPTETGGQKHTIRDAREIYETLRGHLDSAWDRVKNEVSKEEMDHWEMVWCSPQVGKRESRRFEGDYMLTENDLEEGRMFDDAIAVGGFAFDIHYPKPENTEYVHVKYHAIPPLYTIPYRSIYSRNIDNLFFASRLLSVSHLAHGSVRLQRTLSTIGQAAGTAAALCVEHSLSPRELFTKGYVPQLQQILLREDATVPNATNNDPTDLARYASVSASSRQIWKLTGEPEFVPVSELAGAELWSFADRMESCRVLLENSTDAEIPIFCTLARFVPERKWQNHGERPFFDYYASHNEAEWGGEHDVTHFRWLAQHTCTIPPRFSGWVEIPFGVDLAPKDKLTDDDRLAFTIRCDRPGLKIARSVDFHSGLRRIDGIHANGQGKTEFSVLPETVFVQPVPAPLCGEESQVLNGQNRRFSEFPHNMWRPAALPADLRLHWEKPVQARQVRITFDTLERAAIDMPYESNHRASGQAVRTFTLTLYLDGETVYETRQEDAYHRLAVLSFPECRFDELKLTLQSTWEPGRTPGVYEIRVY